MLPAGLGLSLLLLAGCSTKDVVTSMRSYFASEASIQEETPANSLENRLFSEQVYDITGEPMTKADGEPVTVLAAYETATGGEPCINEKGMEETWPEGQVMTYPSGEPVTGENGEFQTYAGGEPVTDVWGNVSKDADGNPVTRAAEEIVFDTVTTGASNDIKKATRTAREMLKEKGTLARKTTLQAPDLPFLRKGDRIRVRAGTAAGYFFVRSVRHNAADGKMTLGIDEDKEMNEALDTNHSSEASGDGDGT